MMADPVFWIEAGIAALIAFAATFSGIFVSFKVERCRKEAEDKERFAQIIHGLLVESATNQTIVNSMTNWARPGKALATEITTEALQTALRDPLLYRWGDHSLVATAHVVRMQSGSINNVLLMHRQAATLGHGMTDAAVKDLQIRAETVREVLGVFQELLEETLSKFGAAVVADKRVQQLDQRLAQIVAKGAGRIEQLMAEKSKSQFKGIE